MTENATESAYSPQEYRPLAPYVMLSAVYNTVVAAVLTVAVRSGRTRPERVSLSDLLLLGVATFKISRIITRDEVTSAFRAPFTRYEGPAGDGELMEKPRGRGLRFAMGEVLTCPFCIGQWVATALVGGLLFAPRYTRLIASVFASLVVSDFLQYAREITRKQAEENS